MYESWLHEIYIVALGFAVLGMGVKIGKTWRHSLLCQIFLMHGMNTLSNRRLELRIYMGVLDSVDKTLKVGCISSIVVAFIIAITLVMVYANVSPERLMQMEAFVSGAVSFVTILWLKSRKIFTIINSIGDKTDKLFKKAGHNNAYIDALSSITNEK